MTFFKEWWPLFALGGALIVFFGLMAWVLPHRPCFESWCRPGGCAGDCYCTHPEHEMVRKGGDVHCRCTLGGGE